MNTKLQSLFDKLSVAEKNLLSGETEFLSPVIASQPVKVAVEGIAMRFFADRKGFEGWGIFKVTNHVNKIASFVREATWSERQAYLDLLPKFNAVVYQQGQRPHAVVKGQCKKTIIDGTVQILLAENISLFDCVAVRWDGTNFWYNAHSQNVNVANAELLQGALANKVPPEKLEFHNLTPAEKTAYVLAYERVRDTTKDRLENALRRSGGKLVKYTDRGTSYTVTYSIGDNQYTSTVDNDLRVQSAGICLSGGDKNFDLQSLIHVIKEGEQHHAIVVRDYSNYGYNGGYDEDD